MTGVIRVRGIATSVDPSDSEPNAADPPIDVTAGSFVGVDGRARTFYRIASPLNGPPVLVLHEIYGLTAEDLRFCRRLAQSGFTAYAPVLFGFAGNSNSQGALAAVSACVGHEFALFSRHRSSPITDSLRVLGTQMHAEHPQYPGIGVIGLCLTGNFALAMMADPHVLAPVLSEPSLPFGLTADDHAAIGLSPDEIATVKARIEKEGLNLLGFRFEADWICKRARFDTLATTFPGGFIPREVQRGRKKTHSVFAVDYDPTPGSSTEREFHVLVEFLQRRLATALNPR